MKLKVLIGLCLVYSYHFFSQSISGVVNNYVQVNATAGANITVASVAGFAVGNQVLIIQMQGTSVINTNNINFGNISSMGGAGTYEFKDITAIAGNVITVNSALTNTYNTATGSTQLVRVPKYCQATVTNTLTCTPWNGTIGGIIAIEVGTLTLNSDINASALGFRGGNFATSSFCCSNGGFAGTFNISGGQKGESISRWLIGQDGMKGKQANGGGGSNCGNSGGGGGGNAGAGGLGGNQYNGCGGFDERGMGGLNLTPATSALFLGGGGGGGFRDNGQVCTAGGNGGGIIYIKANQIICNNRIVAASGGSVTIIANDEGSGGGGAGGTIFIECNNYVGNLTVNTNGGSGGRNNNTIFTTNCHGPGGGGGGGAYAFSSAGIPGGVTYVSNGGAAGIVMNPASTCYNTTFGAAPGNNGSTLANLPTAILPYNPLPISITGNTAICTGQQTTLTANTTATGVVTYSWSTGITTPSITLAPTATSIYTIVLTGSICVATSTVAVSVNATPTISLISNSGPVCQGSNVNFSVNTTTAGTASYLWNGVNNFISNIKNPTLLSAQPINSGVYTITVTNTFTNGAVCSATATSTLAVVPFATVSVSPPSSTLCQGANLNLSSSTSVFPNSYSWVGPATFASNLANPSITNIMPANAGNYSLTVLYTSPSTTFGHLYLLTKCCEMPTRLDF